MGEWHFLSTVLKESFVRISTKIAGIFAGTGIILAATVAPAMAEPNDVSGTVAGGNLTLATSAAALSSVTLDGLEVKHATGDADSAWTITDARGTGAAWALQASATDFTSAAGTVDETERTIAIENLLITPGEIVAGTGSDPATTASALTMSNVEQTLVAATDTGKGSYTFTPGFDLSIPVNAFRSNFTDALDGDANPYVSTVTYTLS
jgi:hypothetical protein